MKKQGWVGRCGVTGTMLMNSFTNTHQLGNRQLLAKFCQAARRKLSITGAGYKAAYVFSHPRELFAHRLYNRDRVTDEAGVVAAKSPTRAGTTVVPAMNTRYALLGHGEEALLGMLPYRAFAGSDIHGKKAVIEATILARRLAGAAHRVQAFPRLVTTAGENGGYQYVDVFKNWLTQTVRIQFEKW